MEHASPDHRPDDSGQNLDSVVSSDSLLDEPTDVTCDESLTSDLTVAAPRSVDFERTSLVNQHLGQLLEQCRAGDATAALLPWFCDALPSAKSRRDYFAAMKKFFHSMHQHGISPYEVTGDHVRLYKETLIASGMKASSVCQALSVIRGTYQQFGKKGLVSWLSLIHI